MNNKLIVAALSLLLTYFSQAQDLTTFTQKADSIFQEFNKSGIPGVAVGIIKSGQSIYLKGFGTANLETQDLITSKTKFQLGELSKQFTSLSILLLEEQGKISLNDDIRKYLIELPEYSHVITIKHLLNHSSGLHDIARVNMILSGSPIILNQEKALQLVSAQEKLAFIPGTAFSFHEAITESVLMAEIVSRSSGTSFPDFVKVNIFQPLGMLHSLIRADSEALISGLATAYQKEEGEEYKKNEVRTNVIGAINGYSTAEDMTLWYQNFTHPKGTLGKMIQRLDKPVQLTNGEEFVYYWGKMTIGREFGHPERGLPIYWHFGFQGGYGTNVFRYPHKDIVTFVLGNNNQYNGGLASDAISHLVEDDYLLPPVVDYDQLKTVKLSSRKLKSYEGNYWFQPAGYATRIFVENDTLRNQWLFGSRYNTLVPINDHTFQQVGSTDEIRRYKFVKERDQIALQFKYNQSEEDIMEKYIPAKPSLEILESYSGTYYNEAYTSLMTISVSDGELVVTNTGHTSINYRPTKVDVFSSATLFMPAMEFVRNALGDVIGLKIDGDGVHSLHFTKVK